MHRPGLVPCFGLTLLLAGCADPTGVSNTGPVGDETGTSEDTDTGEPWEPIPARGDINLSSIVVNQAIDVPIANDGEWVGPEERNTYVVRNRDTLLRGFWDIPEDWVDRPITARLLLRYPGGEEETRELTVMIDGPSYPGDLDRAFNFPILAEDFAPGLQYQMSLWEAEPGHDELPESTTVITSPASGLEQIGIQGEPVELKVALFPVDYNDQQGCDTSTAELSDEDVQNIIDWHHEHYPVQEVKLDFRRDEPIVVNEPLGSLTQLWAPLQDRRAADQAEPNYYYYAIVDVCGGGVDGAAGIAPGLATDLKTAAFERVSSGVWLGGSTSAIDTMVHELGHNHGRAHIFCANGDAAGTDPSYPHDDGVIGVWGFGIRTFRLKSPTSTWDMMTYCTPSWVSDWGWSKAFERIRTLTAWDYEGAPAPGSDEGDLDPAGEVMIGLLFEDGTEQWTTTVGAREAAYYSSGESVRFRYGDAVIDSPSNVQILDDGTTMVTVAIPRPRVEFHQAARIDAAGREHALTLQTPESRIWQVTER